jgi:outer membrane receptor for ferric coprogen and ferric-rhodotorulic acid
VFTTYAPGELSKLTVGGGVNWESRTYTADPAAPAAAIKANGGLIEQDSFALVNLMARYDISDKLSAQEPQQRHRQDPLRHVCCLRCDHLRRTA